MEKYAAELKETGSVVPVGLGYAHLGLPPALNFYVNLMSMLEHLFDVREHHSATLTVFFVSRHISKVKDPSIKCLHIILFGPPGSGKTFVMDKVSQWTTFGRIANLQHSSAQVGDMLSPLTPCDTFNQAAPSFV